MFSMMPFRAAVSNKLRQSSNNECQLNILKTYPLLIPTNAFFNKYEGFLKVKEFCLRVTLDVPHYPSVHEMSLSCGWELKELLSSHADAVSKVFESSGSLLEFLDNFCRCIERAIESNDNNSESCLAVGGDVKTYEEQVENLKHCSTVLSELQTLGTKHLQFLSSDLKTVILESYDLNGDKCSITLRLVVHYFSLNSGRNRFEVVDTDLPDLVIKEIEKEKNIIGAYSKFCHYLEALYPLWSSLELIDKHCWVIDPKHPKKADMYRRISISSRVMAQISWNPLQPLQKPEIKFQGADLDVDGLHSTYEQNLDKWCPGSDVIENLCSVLSLAMLPGPPDSEKIISQAVDTGECCICYDVHLNGKLPEESCGKCLHNFHAACLYEWLEMMPGSRQVHGHITGSCPNCECIIKCPCPHSMV